MSARTDELIRTLARDLRPVRVLESLPRVSARVLGATALALAATTAWAASADLTVPQRPSATALAAMVLHAGLATGALLAALASCVPGREGLAAGGRNTALAAGLLTAGGALWLASGALGSAAAPGWTQGVLTCTGLALMPAVVPGVLLLRFARVGAPARPLRTLAWAALASLSLAALPGHVGCPVADPIHGAVGHWLAPATAGLVLLVGLFGLWRALPEPGPTVATPQRRG